MSVVVPRPLSLRELPGRRCSFRRPNYGISVSMGGSSMYSRPEKGGEEDCSAGTYLAYRGMRSVQGELRLDRLQPPDLESRCKLKRVFGRFVAREAMLEEELWTASWLRAESHYEDQPYLRYVKNYKKMFAEQEFAALKRRCNELSAEKCTCIVVERATTFLSNVYREDGARYGYIGNLCVAKCLRRQGIARNMIYLAVEAAKSEGVEQVFVHVDRENNAARKLYENLGFEVVGSNNCTLSSEAGRKFLMILTR